MLYAIAGSQGSGKSTILTELEKKGCNVVLRKTSRSILEDWDVSLQEVNNDPMLTTKFQDEITNRKYIDELDAYNSKEVWFTERTHTDLFTYALISLGKDNHYSDWLDNYYSMCVAGNKIYKGIFYLKAGLFDVQHDGTRGSNKHYSRMVDILMEDLSSQMYSTKQTFDVIEKIEINKRIQYILDVVTM